MICRCGNEVQLRAKKCDNCGDISVKRGEVFWANLKGVDGLEISDTPMPVLIMQNNKGNAFSTTTLIFYSPLIVNALKSLMVVVKNDADYYDGIIMTTIDKLRLKSPICMLPQNEMSKVEKLIMSEIYWIAI